MPAQSSSLLLCFPTSSSTPSLAGPNGVFGRTNHRPFAGTLVSGIYFCFLLFTNAAMLCLGAVFLSWLELPAETDLRQGLAGKRARLIEELLHNSTASAKQLDELLGLVQNAAQKGIITHFPDGDFHHNSAWSFGSAFLFLTTIATTVGYGHAAPQTTTGKVFSMIYGTIAIPLLLAFFSELIRKVVAVLNWIFMKTAGRESRHDSIERSISKAGNRSFSDVRTKVAFVLVISVLLILSTVFVPALVFAVFETRWSYLDGIYYTFISMTTVGLGDVIPGEGPEWNLNPEGKEFYHVAVAAYLLSALPLFFLAIKLISSLASTAELSFRHPLSDDSDHESDPECYSSNPRIKVYRDEDADDDDDMYDASSGLIGKSAIVPDSETQMTSDGESGDDDVDRSKPAVVQSTGIDGSFSYLHPQPSSK